MNSWLVWVVFAAVAAMLGAVGYHFSLRTLRWVALIVTLATAAYLTVYGLTHPAQKPGNLSDMFARSADTLSTALIRPLSLGHHVPAPGQIGWLVIVALLVLGYRALEAWTLRRQAPCLDTSELTRHRQDNEAGAATNIQTGKQLHERLGAELKFRLPAVEVRSPAILPGGSRPSGLASIAEATGVDGAGLAGAIIRFFGMIWPSPPRIQVRAWVEQTPGPVSTDNGVTRVTVSLADPRSGASVATKTLAAENLDAAAAAVAGYVARHIFARDRTVPPWSTSATDGADLAALLRARQVRAYPESHSGIRSAWKRQIEILEGVAHGNLCAGVVRYELAQLYDLTGRHVEALLLHAANREQYPRFYRGRYRLAMSLEMLTNPESGLEETDTTKRKEVLRILGQYRLSDEDADRIDDGQAGPPNGLGPSLLAASWQELQAIEHYLTWRRIILGAFLHRNERSVLRPYRQPRHRQAFHDGVRAAQLLVAVRQAQMPGAEDVGKLCHARAIARITAAISGDSKVFAKVLPEFPSKTAKQKTVPARLRTRLLPWQCSSPSWPAAYNLACAYAALADREANHRQRKLLVSKVVGSLEFAICNPECEMERPSEWIGNDPDFNRLSGGKNIRFMKFLDEQWKRDYPVGG